MNHVFFLNAFLSFLELSIRASKRVAPRPEQAPCAREEELFLKAIELNTASIDLGQGTIFKIGMM